MDALGREHVGADRLDQRHQGCRAGADPVGQRRDVELDALAGIGRALAVERQVQAVLGEQHMRQQPRPGAPARDRVRRRRRLGDRSRRLRQENFSRTCWITFHWRGTSSSVSVTSSPSLRKRAAAARAGRRRRIDHALARQMLGQRPARRLAPRRRPAHRESSSARRHLRRRSRLAPCVLLEIGELQLELVEQRAALRGLAELLVPQLRDRDA